MKFLAKLKKEPLRILGLIAIGFAIFQVISVTIENAELKELTPEKCTMETEGITVDYTQGVRRRYGSSREYGSNVYYDIIEYVVDNHTYRITSRHAYKSEPVIGAITTVNYNPDDPSKAYDNTPPYADPYGCYYSMGIAIMGLVLLLRLDKKIPGKNKR